MKSQSQFQIVLAGIAMYAVAASAQDRISVPLRDPSRPATVVVNLQRGNVTVKGYSGREVLIDSSGQGGDAPGRGRRNEIPQGMHRVDAGMEQFEAVEDNNVVTIRGGRIGSSAMTIQVPANSSIKLRQMSGRVTIDGVTGEIDVNTTNGSIDVNGASSAVLAHSTNGRIVATFRQLPASQPVNLSTMNGDIDLTLPADVKAKLVMKTENGDIVTDFDLKVDASANAPVVEDKRDGGGRYRVSRGRTLTGTINGGGGNIELTSYNGRLMIGKAK